MTEVAAIPVSSEDAAVWADRAVREESTVFQVAGRKLALVTDPHVFTPTLTTSLLTMEALANSVEGIDVLDLGCGLGPIAIVLARAGARHVWAVDLMRRACELARVNARINGVSDRITVLEGNLFRPVAGRRFGLIVDDVSGVAARVARLSRWFPDQVPLGGEDGSELTVQMLQLVGEHLAPGGQLYFPVLSLSNRSRILEVAGNVFGQNLSKVATKQVPFSPELKASLEALSELRERGVIHFEQVRSRLCWTLEIYRGALDA